MTQIFNSTIYGGQAVISGHSVDHTTLSAAAPPAWPELRDTLADMGVPGADLAELLDAIKRDDGLGEQTQGWLGRLAGKVGRGAITLGTGVTTEVLALEIAKALGAG